MNLKHQSNFNLSTKLNHFLQNLTKSLNASQASLTLSLFSGQEKHSDTEIRISFKNHNSVVNQAAETSFERQIYLSFPLSFISGNFAKAKLCLPNHVFCDAKSRKLLETLAHDIEKIIVRHRVNKSAEKFLNKSLQFIGNSKSVNLLERELHFLSQSSSNLLLCGEKGSGKVIAALVVHTIEDNQNAPFISINLSDWKAGKLIDFIERYMLQAFGGTLYVRCGEIVSQSLMRSIVEIVNQNSKCRVILGLTASKYNINLTKDCSPSLFQEFATVNLPSLNQRKNDISQLINHFLLDERLSEQITLRDDCITLLENFVWKGGVKQLYKLLHNVILENTETEITPDSLIYCCPELRDFANNKTPIQLRNIEQYISSPERYEANHRESHHPAVMRALKYIGDNYQNQLDLKSIASQACVSASHLSFLIKSQFGMSPMQLINRYKIERAKQLLRCSPLKQITEISSELGFWDLSHFEKVFKRWAGVTPKQFRKNDSSIQEGFFEASRISQNKGY